MIHKKIRINQVSGNHDELKRVANFLGNTLVIKVVSMITLI